MPTAKPRITITLTEHAHSVLSSLAQAQKVSMSSIVVDLVDTTLPVLERLSLILQNAAQAPQSVLNDLRKSLESAEQDALLSQQNVMGNLDTFVQISSQLPAPGRETELATARVPAPDDVVEVPAKGRPPTSNRGVRISPPTSKIGQISPMKRSQKHGRS